MITEEVKNFLLDCVREVENGEWHKKYYFFPNISFVREFRSLVNMVIVTRNINYYNNNGNTLLMLSTILNSDKLFDFLLSINTKVNTLNSKGYSALMFCAVNGCYTRALKLLERGANATFENIEGQKASNLAFLRGDFKLFKQLQQYEVIEGKYTVSEEDFSRKKTI